MRENDSEENRQRESFMVLLQGGTRYGIESSRVLEVIPMPRITAIPKQPPYIKGIFNYKGTVLPVLSLAGLGNRKLDGQERVCIVFRAEGEAYGMIVDDVLKLIYDTGADIEFNMEDMNGEYLRISRVIQEKKPVFLLDIPAIIKIILQK
ncbi:MAG: chemotaxis protein CheW [Eubacteriales bacterium]|nr:chemotaxis protein CheW [Eubacteriales bacterium]